MNWTEPQPPKNLVSYYDHTFAETPIGKYFIEWKSWKEDPSYDIMLYKDTVPDWIGVTYSLEEAKEVAEKHLIKTYEELSHFINKNKLISAP